MTPIAISWPREARIASVVGEILRDYEQVPGRLSEDILLIALDTGFTIDVGWYPQFDPNGSFQIAVFRSGTDDQVTVISETDPFRVAQTVRELAAEYSLAFRMTAAPSLETASRIIPQKAPRYRLVGAI